MIFGLASMGVLVALLLFGLAASFALGLASVIYFIVTRGFDGIPAEIIAQRLVAGVDSFTLLSIPLFIFVGHLMNESGATTRLFGFANTMVGHVRGGLAHVNIVASMLFAGMSGSGTADAAGLGALEIRAMREAGYDDRTTIGVTASSALIGPIIPPSIPAILYAVLAQVSAADMLLAGLIPGLMMAAALMLLASWYARRRNLPKAHFPGFARMLGAFRSAFATLLTPVILMGGIMTGLFTATEAAAVAALWAFLLATVIYRTLGLRGVCGVLRKATRDTAAVMFILACSSLFAWVLTRARVPDTIAGWLADLTGSPVLVMILIMAFLLVVGCFLAVSVAINILTPILVPIAVAFGFDPVHFGIIMIMLLVIGEATPPFGMVLYVLTGLSGRPFEYVVAASLPWLIAIFAVVVLVACFPSLALWLPEVLG
ncbi:TRAP transporter large permease [Falsirhodobacter halotolerans]|uniref:TRAP transporter large permease n=1 Tax=Falsirhodobacter halotolerans TaxID=1146892 RepID=UPI001FD3EA00|nr:TRAP transporter large permease [Falsirhodobacter halotolerans]MCJ8141023.1 TRAP transporter large permease [Falsirhodobacter halotolerans]